MTDREDAIDVDEGATSGETANAASAFDGPAPWAGVVLAGGGSTRFGEADKLLAELGGTPLVRRVADRLAARTDRLVVTVRPGRADVLREVLVGVPADVSVLTDPEPDRGPLAGMAVGLDAVSSSHEYAAVVAGDTPFVDPALFEYLYERAAPDYDVALVRDDDGYYSTTQALYRASAVARGCERVLASGGGRILDAFEGLEVLTVEEREVRGVVSERAFLDVDTPEDLEVARELLRDVSDDDADFDKG